MASDRELIHRIQDQDAAAFEQLFDRYESAIRWHLVKIVRSDAVAQDLLQEVMLRVWTRAEQWQEQGSFKAWLYRIATNLALNHLRSERRRREQPLIYPDQADEAEETCIPAWIIDQATPDPDEMVENSEQFVRFQRLVGHLAEEKREVLRLIHELGMSIQDTADELDLPAGTVKSRLYYARKQLVHEWNDLEED